MVIDFSSPIKVKLEASQNQQEKPLLIEHLRESFVTIQQILLFQKMFLSRLNLLIISAVVMFLHLVAFQACYKLIVANKRHSKHNM